MTPTTAKPHVRRVCAVAALGLVAACGTTVNTVPGGAPVGANGEMTAGAGGTTELVGPLPSAGRPTSASAGLAGTALRSDGVSEPAAQTNLGGTSVDSGGAGAIPTTGRGWDAHNVYIGVTTINDAHQAASKLHLNFPVAIDPEAMINAIVDYINARGGLLGRKLVAVYHDHHAADAGSPTAAQSDCTYFSSDRPVIAYYASSNGPRTGIEACMHKAQIPFFDLNTALYDDDAYQQVGPYLWNLRNPLVDQFISPFMTQLEAQTYFSGWNTATGAPGSTSANIGLYLEDNALGHRIAAWLTHALPAEAHVTSSYYYDPTKSCNSSDESAAVLRFKAATVTHVLSLPSAPGGWLCFALAAQSQRYYPRYAITSWDWPLFAQQNLPARQLAGSVGVGWIPDADVEPARQPTTPGKAHCLAALRHGGQQAQYSSAPTPSVCDGLFALAAAVQAGGGFTPPAILAGMLRIGAALQPAGTFSNGLSPDNPGALPGSVRNLYFASSCSCYRYRGATRAL